MRVDELAARSGLSVDTIRYYQSKRLIDRPRRDGRTALYDQSHLDRLEEIRRLSEEGFSLDQIRSLNHDDDPLLRTLVRRMDTDGTLDRAALAKAARVPEDIVALVVEIGLIQPTIIDDVERFPASAVSMLSAARAIVGSGVDLNAFAELAIGHAQNTEATIDAAIAMFKDYAQHNDVDRAQLAEILDQLIPEISKLVAGHFQHTLVNRATRQLLPES